MREFFISKTNFSIIKGGVDWLLKIFNNSKRNYETWRQILRVWAKRKLRFEIFRDNFKIYIRKSQRKNDILPIFSPIFQVICQFIQLWKITPFSQQFFRFRRGSFLPCGRRAPLKKFQNFLTFLTSHKKFSLFAESDLEINFIIHNSQQI